MRTLEVSVPYKSHYFFGELTIPLKPLGLIIFSIDKDSSRWDLQNKMVADYLNQHHLATLLIDHTTIEELSNEYTVTDAKTIADRLVNSTLWLENHSAVAHLPIGYFASGTGAGPAFKASAILGAKIKGVVTKGASPYGAMNCLCHVIAPTLLLVGEYDPEGIAVNKLIQSELCGEKSFKIIPKTGSIFNRKSGISEVAELAASWYHIYMGKPTFIQVE